MKESHGKGNDDTLAESAESVEKKDSKGKGKGKGKGKSGTTKRIA